MRHVLRCGQAATLAVAALLCFPFAAASADSFAPPKGELILTVSGRIRNTNDPDGTARFDLAMLEALDQHEGNMQTPWTKGTVRFKGPLGRALLKAVGATGSILKITALNDYSANVPVEDFANHDVIFATRMNGVTIGIRDKGPLFLIYPFDMDSALYNEKYFSRSVWQIKSIDVE